VTKEREKSTAHGGGEGTGTAARGVVDLKLKDKWTLSAEVIFFSTHRNKETKP